MNHFRTIVSLEPSSVKIGLNNKLFTIGSCFADAIGKRLLQAKFNATVNPYGTSYNPISIHKAIGSGIDKKLPENQSFLSRDGIHLNYDYHSKFAASSKDALQMEIQNLNSSTHEFLRHATHILITYGTAWVYERKETGQIVNNCHKIPASSFCKRLLNDQEIVESFANIYTQLKNLNPLVNIILTVSPVRHIKDTLELNCVSKAILRLACHKIITSFSEVVYFPAHEIMMDDLRDYRFYKSDMLHPTEQAEDYVWERFKETYFDSDTIETVESWLKIKMALDHKPFNPSSSSHQNFLKHTLQKLHELKPKINIDAEIAAIQAQIIF